MPIHPLHKLSEIKVSCQSCSLSDLCLPHGLKQQEMDRLEELIDHHDRFEKDSHLYRAGDKMHGLYAVRSGSFKTFISTHDGAEQITGFHLPGELLGLDGFADDHHNCNAVALETSTVCELGMEEFEDICCEIKSIRKQVLHLMGNEINNEHQLMMALGQMKGEERLATFMLSLSKRFSARGFSKTEFNLSMARHDVANYLGLAVETLSRMFSKLDHDGVLQVSRRNVQITDMAQLHKLAHQEYIHCDS